MKACKSHPLCGENMELDGLLLGIFNEKNGSFIYSPGREELSGVRNNEKVPHSYETMNVQHNCIYGSYTRTFARF